MPGMTPTETERDLRSQIAALRDALGEALAREALAQTAARAASRRADLWEWRARHAGWTSD